jgi:hypothetical protein
VLLRTSRNSITPSRAFLTRGVSVLIFMPGPAGMAQEATGLGLFSTCMPAHGGVCLNVWQGRCMHAAAAGWLQGEGKGNMGLLLAAA